MFKNRGLAAWIFSQQLDQVDGMMLSAPEPENASDTAPITPQTSPVLSAWIPPVTPKSSPTCALESWKAAMERSQALLPAPNSRFSRRSELSIRHVCGLMNNPPTQWTGQTIFLAHLYEKKMNERIAKIQKELEQHEERWADELIPCPPGITHREWKKRRGAADAREFEANLKVLESQRTDSGIKKDKKKRRRNTPVTGTRPPVLQMIPVNQDSQLETHVSVQQGKIQALKAAQHLREMRKKARDGLAGPKIVAPRESPF